MGSSIEINDTLKLTLEQGMPENPALGMKYNFHLPGERLYHRPPTRVFLVHSLNGKWKYIGHALVLEQTIHSETQSTSGIFEIKKIYDDAYAKLCTINEAPIGQSYY